jgi:hypothetical protein
MKHINLGVATASFAALVLASFTAYAGHGEEPEHRRMEMAPLLSVLQPQQRQQVNAIFMSDRSRLNLLHEQVREARQALITKLLSPEKSVDVSKEVAKLKQAQEQLIDERIKLALEARKIMTTDQLAKALALWSKWQSLRAQERELFEQARSENQSEGSSPAKVPAKAQSNQ